MPRQFAMTTRGIFNSVCALVRHCPHSYDYFVMAVGRLEVRSTLIAFAVLWTLVDSASLWRSSSTGVVEYQALLCARICWRDLVLCKLQILKEITTAFTSYVLHQR